MSDLLIKNALVYTQDESFLGWVYAREGIIQAIGRGTDPNIIADALIDARQQALLPGFIDIHVHGAVGHDTMDANAEGLLAMAEFFASKGVTAFTPTTLTSTHKKILSALENIKLLMNTPQNGATIVGAHLEGPYLNVEKCGAQNPDFVRLCDRQEALEYLDTGVIRVISVAPEFDENVWLIEECVRRGITASFAHTNASYEQALIGIEKGISHSTHTFNAMTALQHRNPGVVGAVLSENTVNCELIADNIHVHAGAMKTLWQAKGRDRVILITDAMRAAGMPDGEYKLEDLTAIVKNGRALLASGTLAGSILTMDNAIKNFMGATNADLQAILPTFSLNPARAIGLAHRKGSIAQGKDADFVLVDEDFTICQTIVGGRVVYHSS